MAVFVPGRMVFRKSAGLYAGADGWLVPVLVPPVPVPYPEVNGVYILDFKLPAVTQVRFLLP